VIKKPKKQMNWGRPSFSKVMVNKGRKEEGTYVKKGQIPLRKNGVSDKRPCNQIF
jgi:hypothetical protein